MTGRPSDYSEKLGADIASRIACGESVKSICSDDDMPCRATIYTWLHQHKVFLDMYVRAKEDGAEAMAEEMFDIADNGENDWMEKHGKDGENEGWRLNGENVQRSKLRIETRKWYLAKIKPKKYGEKIDLNHGGQTDNPLTMLIQEISGKTLEPEDD